MFYIWLSLLLRCTALDSDLNSCLTLLSGWLDNDFYCYISASGLAQERRGWIEEAGPQEEEAEMNLRSWRTAETRLALDRVVKKWVSGYWDTGCC